MHTEWVCVVNAVIKVSPVSVEDGAEEHAARFGLCAGVGDFSLASGQTQ